MGTKQQTTSQQQSNLQYDPSSLGRYNQLTGSSANVLTQQMRNPLGNPLFKLGQQMGQTGAIKQGQQNINAFNQNFLTSGFGGQAGAAFKASQMGQIGRSNAALRSQANMGNILAAYQRQLGAAGMGLSFSPLMTGTSSSGQSTQTQSGLGTWLPQVMGAGLGAAMMLGTGGMGGGGMGFMGAGSGGRVASQGLSNFNSTMGGVNSGINWSNLAQPPSNSGMGPFNPLASGLPIT